MMAHSTLPRRYGRLAASLCAVASVLISTIGISYAAQPAVHSRAMTKVTLVLKWVPQAQFAGYYVALAKGYYAREGLDVTIQPGGPDVVPESVVENGAADFGIDWVPSLLEQRDHGQDLVDIAQIYQTTGMRLIAFKSSGIKSPADFRGKKIGVWFGGNQFQFLAWMAKVGLNPNKDMTVIHQSFSMDLFLSHKLDMASAMTYNELGVVLESGVKLSQLTIFDYGKAGVSMLEDDIFARAGYLKTHRDVAVRFLKASIMGWQDVVRNPVYAGTLAFSHSPAGASTLTHQIYMAREVDKLMWWGPAKKYGIGYMDPVAFNRTATLSLRYGVIHKMPTMGAYDQSYWRAAVTQLAAQHMLMTGM